MSLPFAEDETEVLSPDLEVHQTKVLGGDYAFFADSVTADLWQSEHCEVLELLENAFGENLYAFHTQKNSTNTASLTVM